MTGGPASASAAAVPPVDKSSTPCSCKALAKSTKPVLSWTDNKAVLIVPMRLFVALDLPDHSKDQLANVVAELRTCDADVRWVHPTSMHLTLKFLGNVEPQEVGAIDESLGKAASAAAPTLGRLRGLGSFPHLRRPRVIWIGLESADEQLVSLQAAVDESCGQLGFAREKRRFHAHVTLGRVRSNRGVKQLASEVESRADLDLGEVPVEAITLFESRLGSKGSRYTPLGVYRLRGPD